MTAETDAEFVERWTLGGYAPGNYLCKCSSCDNGFTGDKRAIQCLPCAAKHTEARIKRLEKALREIASYDEGPKVTFGFDEPISARIARAALEDQ